MYPLPASVRPGDLLFEEGKGFIAWAIKKLTKSKFSHVAIVVDQNTVIEAWPGGVREIPCPYAPGTYHIKTCKQLTDEQRQEIIEHARKFKGTPYDYGRILALLIELGFHIKNRIYERGKIICSVYASLAYWKGAKKSLRPDRPIYHQTPEDLFESPLLSDPLTA
jgi:uncharacterized protein YycO